MLDRPLLAGGGQFNYFEKVAIESARNGTVTRTPPPLPALAANRSLEIPLGDPLSSSGRRKQRGVTKARRIMRLRAIMATSPSIGV